LIQSDALARELARTRDIRGSALARFVLDDRTQPMTIQVDVPEMDVATRHKLLPHELRISSGQVNYGTDRIRLENLRGTLGPSSFSDVDFTVSLGAVPSLEIHSGDFNLSLADLYPWVTTFGPITDHLQGYVEEAAGAISLSVQHLRTPLTDMKLENIDFDVRGGMKNVILISPLLPAEVRVTEGKFEERGDVLRIVDAQTEMLDTSLTVSLVLPDYPQGIGTLDASFQGWLGEKGLNWASDLVDVAPELRVRPPLDVKAADIQWARSGRMKISADLLSNRTASIQVEGSFDTEEVDIEQLTIRDSDSQVTMGFHLEERELHLDWDGRLSHTTMDRILVRNQALAGVVEGDFDAHIFLDRPMKSTATGRLHGVGLGRNLGLQVPLIIEDVVLDADGDTLALESARVTWGDTHLNMEGDVTFSEKHFLVDMDVTGDSLHLRQIKEITAAEEPDEDQEEEAGPVPPVDGVIRLHLDRIETGVYEFSPVRARVDLGPDGVTVDLAETQFCGMDAAGTLKATSQGLSLDLTFLGEGPDVGPLLGCLTEERADATGSYAFQAKVSGEGTPETLADSLQGTLSFEAKDGSIQKSNMVTRLLAYLHVLGILKGKYPGLGEEGFGYSRVRSRTEIKGTKLLVKEFHLDGDTLNVAATGEVDALERTINLTALAAPFTTIEKMVGWVPGLRYVMGGGLIAVPVKVSGNVDDIRITPLAPSAIGSSLLSIMGRIVTAPVKIIEPAAPKETQ
jgi:hypothetical protein